VIPADAVLTPRHEEIPAYDDMPEELKPVLERQMEVYAGFLEHTDHHIGRLLDTLEELEIYDDTLIYLIIGDNGASAEGTINGSYNEMFIFNGAAAMETPEFLIAHVDSIGSPAAYNHYAVGWAHAMCTPYQWTKQIASHWGGTRNGTVVSWPGGMTAAARSGTSSTTSSTSLPPCSTSPGCRSPTSSTGSSRCRCMARAWPIASTHRTRRTNV
jgi:arylsulfatase